jgi:ribose transport system permease protein
MKKLGINLLTKYRTLTVLILMLLVATFLSDAFLSVDNILNVIRQVAIIAIVAAGMEFVILTGGIDLSVGSIIAFSGAISASVMLHSNSLFLAVVAALLVGAAWGLFNGVFITIGGIPPFIVTLATMTLVRGCVMVYTDGSPISVESSSYLFIGKGRIFGMPFPIIILALTFLVGFLILKYTKFGRNVFSIGGNREATRLSGINIKKTETFVYMLIGILAGLTGLILTSRLGSAEPTAGTGYELDAIAAVILGGTSLAGGQGAILPTVVGALILGVLDNILTLMNVNPYVGSIAKGAVILLAVLADSKFKNLSLKVDQK